MSLGAESFLTSLCFADDVILVAASAPQLQQMIADLRRAAATRGLKIHSGKTKILFNSAAVSNRQALRSFTIDGEEYLVLGLEESTKYLGRKISFNDPHGTEFVTIDWPKRGAPSAKTKKS